ncbi:DUF3040 domain-containing protein [Actinomycetospora termitidis]|uniref:DUF3040 domain-containing protein n=1 Tax=Actinomycetospora termitidis TaxID=3053470 RepID=A0ABT7M3G7_9PSEU|nr:DUF3040 domain-containing protein [Actinomycetospora sp. Odt1-22]MDL5155212.1 DUF3040 domain-containing protein [Actinomycetospora sp. Odt1-22]
MPLTPPDPAPLTGPEQAVLASIADHEHRADARFADALAVGVLPVPRRSWRVRLVVAVVLVALATATVLLSGAWLLALAAVALLVVVPTGLVIWALRQGRVDPD